MMSEKNWLAMSGTMMAIMKAYAEADYQGYIRPDHGRHLWSENTEAGRPRPGYGLYDRAMVCLSREVLYPKSRSEALR